MSGEDRLPGGFPERESDPRDDLTGWERPAFACGCGRGCVSWEDHHARVTQRCECGRGARFVCEPCREDLAQRVDREDVADEMDARRECQGDQ